MMQVVSLAALALLAQNAAAQNMLRFGCSQLTIDRVDPIVNPGMRYTPHLHQIIGGNSFNITMDPTTHDLPSQSTCTSCTFKEDLSNYWTAVMFATDPVTKNVIRVPQTQNGGPQGQALGKGGITIYYMKPGGSGSLTAFKPGFRMIAGNAANTDSSKVTKGNICFRGWKSTDDNQFTGGAPCTGADSVDIPQDKSNMMIRQTIIFPSCWDGKNLDSPDHHAHMAYGGTGALSGGNCPSTHPVKTPQIMYEVMWNVTEFARNASMWANSFKPYTLSMDPESRGAGAHGDYVFGWKGDTLQKAMDKNCNLDKTCAAAGITAQSESDIEKCTLKQWAPEPVTGWLKSLPLGDKALKA